MLAATEAFTSLRDSILDFSYPLRSKFPPEFVPRVRSVKFSSDCEAIAKKELTNAVSEDISLRGGAKKFPTERLENRTILSRSGLGVQRPMDYYAVFARRPWNDRAGRMDSDFLRDVVAKATTVLQVLATGEKQHSRGAGHS